MPVAMKHFKAGGRISYEYTNKFRITCLYCDNLRHSSKQLIYSQGIRLKCLEMFYSRLLNLSA